ncbi:hypothetical protein [Lysinibacter cavernae]|uniref:Uncharacterized protein n=1 Tax=Lysinibacter cavernae TaxID=1640652 RepID=A0A7X5QZZ0_9MICO|nr:hypothetical protein [Lysinibacter cavernae]NIH53051.1 hypothetical protein [Lysinibacter cavernae]
MNSITLTSVTRASLTDASAVPTTTSSATAFPIPQTDSTRIAELTELSALFQQQLARLFPSFTVVPLRTGALRVCLASGQLFGYVQPIVEGEDIVYRAQLHRAGTALNRPLGDFSRIEDALDSLARTAG